MMSFYWVRAIQVLEFRSLPQVGLQGEKGNVTREMRGFEGKFHEVR
jgi:hypothetical protein